MSEQLISSFAERGTRTFQPLVVPKESRALRLVRRLTNGELRVYEAITFPKRPYEGCEITHRRAKTFGYIAKDEDSAYGLCDIVDDDGDIVSDFPLTHAGFKWLKRTLKCRIEP